jgi:Chalcone isomerase-like
MTFLKSLILAAVLGICSSGAFAATQEISGVKVDDSTEVRGTKLALNGAGVRYKGPFKVYVAGLYTGKKAATLDELVNQPGPKRMQITMVRDIEANEFGKLLTRGMEDNTSKAEMSKLVPGLLKMSALFSEHKKLVAGDSFSIDWVPGVGATVNIKGKAQVDPFKEPEFYKALMGIWLGPVPADFKLKDALLGIKG